jgi:hypothetical protein
MLSTRPFAVLGTLLALGFTLFGAQISRALRRGKEFERYLTVRGLSEREVQANQAVWPIHFSNLANDLAALKEGMQRDRGIVFDYLREQGIGTNEVSIGLPSVTDRADQKVQADFASLQRFRGTTTIVVRSSAVERVKGAIQHADLLLERGISLSESEGGRPQFLFTGVNATKPDMIREATANARAAAEQFAQDSRTHVGAIRHASQGVLEIDDRDPASPERKLLRVVTTVEFFVE